MPDDQRDAVRRSISSYLAMLRRSIDFPLPRRPELERERRIQGTLLVEEARLRFNKRISPGYRSSSEDWVMATNELKSFLDKFTQFAATEPSLLGFRFRSEPTYRRVEIAASPLLSQLVSSNAPSVADAVAAFRIFLGQLYFPGETDSQALAFEDLRTIVPQQKVAPVQFDVVSGRVVIVNRSPKSLQQDRSNIASALDHIKSRGDQLIENLEKSNCDRRLLDSVMELHSQIVADGNIVKVGLTNMACGTMFAQFQPELPDAIVAMCSAYCGSIAMYVAQFPEWEQFTEKAAAVDLDEEDIADIDTAADEVVSSLLNSPTLADPEVPKTIAFIKEFLSLPGRTAKRAAFAMIRTLENLVSSILSYALDFLSKTAQKTTDGASTTAARVIVGLLSLALIGASGIGSAALRTGAPWVKQAAEIVQKQIERME